MSWLSDFASATTRNLGNQWSWMTSAGHTLDNDVSRWFENEAVNKADLRGAQAESLLAGVPGVGDILKGVEGVNQLEDLYNRTGKLPVYPAQQNLGSSSLGHGLDILTRKIEPGTHDLAEFYSGDRDINSALENVNGYRGPHVVHRGDNTTYRNYANL